MKGEVTMAVSQKSTGTLTDGSPLLFILCLVLSCLLLIDPLFPDVQITRPKLLVLELGIFILLLLWLVNIILTGRIYIRKTNLNIPVLFYVVYIFTAYFLSNSKPVALSELKRMLLCASIFFVSTNVIVSDKNRSIILLGWVCGTTLAVIYGIFQRWGQVWIFVVPQIYRVFSTFGNPIFFAVHIVVFIPVVMGLFLYVYSNKKISSFLRFLYLLLLFCVFGASLFALYLTETRAAWIAFGFSLVLFIILSLKSNKLKITFILLLIVCGLFFAYSTKHIWFRHQAHTLIWRDTLNMWLHYPVFGIGPGSFHIYFPKFASEQLLAIWPQRQSIINDSHNEYIQILAETGIVGFGIFMWIIAAFFGEARKNFYRNTSNTNRFLITGLVCSAMAALVQNIFSVDMRFIISAVYLFLVMGLLSSFEEQIFVKSFRISNTVKITGLIILVFLAGSVLQQILKPYLAQRRLSNEPDFFEKKPAEVIAELEKKTKLSPNDAKVYEQLGWDYAKQKNWAKAIENFEQAIRINPNLYGAFNNLGNIYFYLGNRRKSIECYQNSIAINPKQVDAHTNLGIMYYYEGMLKEASDEFTEVLQLDPKNEKAIVMLKKMRE